MANNARSVRNQQSKTTGDGGSSSAQEPLTHLTCGPEGIAFAPVEDISKKLYEEYHALSARVALLESDSGKAKQDVDKRFKAVDKSIDSHSSTLTRLFREVRVLESVALKYRPSNIAIIVRRQLDDARFCVADGFMTVLPFNFDSYDILNANDETGTTVEWYKFKAALWAHYSAHVSAHDQAKFQTDSVFKDTRANVLLCSDDPLPPADPLPPFRPNPELFKGELLMPGSSPREDIATALRLRVVPSDLELYRQFRLYIPVFIWAYNVLKKAICDDDESIRITKAEINRQHDYLEEYNEPKPRKAYPEIPDLKPNRFAFGTARVVREMWSGFVDAVVSGRDNKEKATAEDEPFPPAFLEALKSSSFESATAAHVNNVGQGRISPQYPHRRKRSAENEEEARPTQAQRGLHHPNVPSTFSASLLPGRSQSAKPLSAVVFYLDALQANIKVAIDRRTDHLNKFNSVMRCLTILLDTNLLNLAVFGESFVRIVTNHFVHKKNAHEDELVADAMGRIQELIQKYTARSVEASTRDGDGDTKDDGASDGEQAALRAGEESTHDGALHAGEREDGDSQMEGVDSHYVEASRRLSFLVYKNDDYFDSGETWVEKAVDEYLCEDSVHDGDVSNGDDKVSDLLVLLAWMESFDPYLTAQPEASLGASVVPS